MNEQKKKHASGTSQCSSCGSTIACPVRNLLEPWRGRAFQRMLSCGKTQELYVQADHETLCWQSILNESKIAQTKDKYTEV